MSYVHSQKSHHPFRLASESLSFGGNPILRRINKLEPQGSKKVLEDRRRGLKKHKWGRHSARDSRATGNLLLGAWETGPTWIAVRAVQHSMVFRQGDRWRLKFRLFSTWLSSGSGQRLHLPRQTGSLFLILPKALYGLAADKNHI